MLLRELRRSVAVTVPCDGSHRKTSGRGGAPRCTTFRGTFDQQFFFFQDAFVSQLNAAAQPAACQAWYEPIRSLALPAAPERAGSICCAITHQAANINVHFC